MLQTSIIVSAFVAFVVLLIEKIGLRTYLIEALTIEPLSKMLACDFCLSFWLSFIISLVLFVITDNESYLFIPFISTPITRILL